MNISLILQEVISERQRQDEQWGGIEHDDKHGPDDWVSFICYQANKISPYNSFTDNRERFVKVAALAVAAIERMDRLESKNQA